MRTSTFLLAAASAYSATAHPLASYTESSSSSLPTGSAKTYDWSAGYASEVTIHSSCNATERHQLEFALKETAELATHAKEHILVQGNNSEIYQKYFGNGPSAPVIGWLEKVASGNKDGVVFRCDDPDENCATQDAWAGHHRGSNATLETVICPLSYTTRWPLTQLCSRGFTISTGKLATYWAADLMHRLFHVPLIGGDEEAGGVGHHADGYEECVELAKGENVTLAGGNSASIYYFAMEAYAFDIAVPGEGCVGKVEEHEHDHDDDAASSTSSAATTVTATATATTLAEVTTVASSTAEASATATAAPDGGDCHTHDDGEVHCT